MAIRFREKIWFNVFLLIFLLPVITLKYFPTTDGPSHLYNASLIKQLLFNNNISSLFFHFNTYPQLNWSGHVLLTLLQCLLPAWLAEKLLLITYVSSLAFSFRLLVLQINNNVGFGTFLIFPFLYTFIFYLGFYNFLLSLPLIFFICWYWNRNVADLSAHKFIVMAILFLVIYFSHLLSFAIAVLCVCTMVLFHYKKNEWMKQIVLFICSVLPCLLLASIFFFNNKLTGFNGTIDYLPIKELIGFLTDARPLICYTQLESEWTQIVFFVFLVLIITQMVMRLKLHLKNKLSYNFFKAYDVWFLLAMFSIILLFAIPDNIASGGFVSIRLSLFVFLFFAIWLAVAESVSIIKNVAILIVVFVTIKLSYDRFQSTNCLCNEVKIIEQASKFINNNSVVLPLNYSTRWTTINTLNYVGCIKQVVVLDNYEAGHKTFPLLWNTKVDPSIYLGEQGKNNHPCVSILEYEKRIQHKVDYVITFQRDIAMNDSCTLSTLSQLNTLYRKIFEDETRLVEVY